MSVFVTRNTGVAALCRYLFGSVVHLSTRMDLPRGALFTFSDDDGKCHDAMQQYQRNDGGSGFAVACARTLIDETYRVRETVKAAHANGGVWENAQ